MVSVKFFFSHRSSVWLLFKKQQQAPELADLPEDDVTAVVT